MAEALRPSDQFFKYCCRDYSVWEYSQTKQRSVIQGKFATGGYGWVFVKGELCCEEAEALAGIPGACSSKLQNQQNVKCWPGSYAAWNDQANKWECFCKTGLVWNSTKTACVDPQELVKTADCSVYAGSYAAWNEQTQKVECWCPKGKKWNDTKTACIDDPSQVTCWPGSYAALNPQTNHVECYCNPGLVWNSTKTACVDPQELVKNTDCSAYPGSYAAWNASTQKVECWCPEGKKWNDTKTACIDDVAQVKCWPGSHAALNPQTQKTECDCNPGLVWNSTKTACVDPQELVKNADCSVYPGSFAEWNAQTQKVECHCPQGKVWNSTMTACIDATTKTSGDLNWNGTFADSYSRATVSGSGNSVSCSWTYNVSGAKGTASWSNCKVVGNTVSGNWTAQHEDDTKTGTRKGTFTATLSGNTLSGQLVEDTPSWNYKPGYNAGNVQSSMQKGAVWPFTWQRQ